MNEWASEPWYIYRLLWERRIVWGKSTAVPVGQRITPGTHNTLLGNDPYCLCFLLQCLVTCGKGHKHRQVWCQFGEDRVNDRICDPESKPASMQTCQQPECASWQAGPWGQVFWMIKFLTTFFPCYLKRACSWAFQGRDFNAASVTCTVPPWLQVKHEKLQPFCPSSKDCHLPTCSWLLPLQTHVHVYALGSELDWDMSVWTVHSRARVWLMSQCALMGLLRRMWFSTGNFGRTVWTGIWTGCAGSQHHFPKAPLS